MYLNAKPLMKLLLPLCILVATLATTVLAPKDVLNISSGGKITYPVKIMRSVVSHSFQNIELEYIAHNFDLFNCFPHYFGPKIRDVKALNPGITALVYRNFRAIYTTNSTEYNIALSNGWILRDSAGKIVRSTQWSQNVMADIGNSSYQDFVVNWIKETMNQYGYDGVFLDNSFSVRKSEIWFRLTAQPINPRTGKEWTGEEIKQACIEVHNKLRQAIGSRIDVANGIFHGHRFFENYEDYVDLLANTSIDGFMSEGMWFEYRGSWFTAQEWRDSLDFLVWVQENFLTKNKIFWMTCDVPRGSLPPSCTYHQMIRYAFASSLLGVNKDRGSNFLALFEAYNDGDLFLNDYVKTLHALSIGEPLNSYYEIKTNVFCRDFANVKVLVNPTSNTYTVDLGGVFETLNGDEVSILDLKPHSGIILTRM